MKHIFFSILLIAAFLGAFNLLQKKAFFYPKPTDRKENQREGEENEAARQAYIEHIHRTSAQDNWQAIEMENRFLRMKQRVEKLKSGTRGIQDTVAQDIIGTWQEVGSQNVTGRIVYADWWQPTGEIYAAADGGSVWRGKDDGTQWQVMNNLFELDDIIYLRVLPKNAGKRIFVVAPKYQTHSFFYTDDEGLTWQNPTGTGYNTILNYGKIYECVVANDSFHTIYVIASDTVGNSLYKSQDLGNTFSRITKLAGTTYGGGSQIDLWTDRDGSGTLYLLGKNKCHKLIGNALTQLAVIPSTSYLEGTLTGAEIAGTTYLYARFKDDITGNNMLFASVNGGANWANKGTLPDGMFMRNSFGCSSITPSLVYLGNIEVHKSTDGGTNFNIISNWWEYYDYPASKVHADVPAITTYQTAANTEMTLICTDGGIFKSMNQCQNVQNITQSGLRNSQYYSTYTHRTNTNYIFAGAQDQGFQRSNVNNGGVRSFIQLISGDYGHIVSSNGGNTIWTNYPGSTMVYANYTSPNNSAWLDFPCIDNLWLAPLMADPDDPMKAYLAGGNSGSGTAHIYHLSYANGNISSNEENYDFGAAISALAYSPANTNYRYVMNDNGQFFLSTNKGQSWTNKGLNGLPLGHYFYGNALLCSPSYPNTVYIGGSGYSNAGVYKTTDGGNTYTAMVNGLPSTLVYGLACTPDESLIFAATESGPYVYKQSDTTWYYLGGTSAPDELFWSVEYIPSLHIARFGTYGRGIWDFVLDTSMYVGTENYHLLTTTNIYPNPAAEKVYISLANSTLQNASLQLFNQMGQNVKTQQVNHFPAEMSLDGLPCGSYLLRIISAKGEIIENEKLIVR